MKQLKQPTLCPIRRPSTYYFIVLTAETFSGHSTTVQVKNYDQERN